MAEKINGKKLRFAKAIRVSTEQQEQQGESLRVQHSQAADDIPFLNGTVVETYGGQEHATDGWEKAEIERLLADAERDRFDAVWFSHPDRWSRDNAMSHRGLEVFLEHGIRFFIGRSEQNLADPQVRLMLAVHAAMGAYHAQTQTKKSMEARIHRAKRGIPTGGNLPYGRERDKENKEWIVNEESGCSPLTVQSGIWPVKLYRTWQRSMA
jgi:site-specific DNA recombinase